MLALRLSRIAGVASVTVLFALIAIGNVSDYSTNLVYVQHVLSMDTTFKSPSLMWRAITTPALHHAAYVLIIACQILTTTLLLGGVVAMWRARAADRPGFFAARHLAILGLTGGVLLYGLGFLAIAGEWFSMWQSKTWNSQMASAILLGFSLLTLIHLCGAEE